MTDEPSPVKWNKEEKLLWYANERGLICIHCCLLPHCCRIAAALLPLLLLLLRLLLLLLLLSGDFDHSIQIIEWLRGANLFVSFCWPLIRPESFRPESNRSRSAASAYFKTFNFYFTVCKYCKKIVNDQSISSVDCCFIQT